MSGSGVAAVPFLLSLIDGEPGYSRMTGWDLGAVLLVIAAMIAFVWRLVLWDLNRSDRRDRRERH